jgi:hypothetical protein
MKQKRLIKNQNAEKHYNEVVAELNEQFRRDCERSGIAYITVM